MSKSRRPLPSASRRDPRATESIAPTAWRHRTKLVAQRSVFLPAPGWTEGDDETIGGATQPYAVAQGDGEESMAAPGPGLDGGVPTLQADTGAAQNMTAGGAATAPGSMPRMDAFGGAQVTSDTMPSVVTRLTVPSRGGHMALEVPAERVDAAAANALDEGPDAPLRLARLPPATPAKLALPVYPPVAEAREIPGRVNVGCTITVHGLPSDCAVTRHIGGHGFADAVLSWLHSGEVRYRPHLVRGTPVPESRLYDVKFLP
ncbi:MAG: energy transducer TonB [Rhodospirillales bacterium]